MNSKEKSKKNLANIILIIVLIVTGLGNLIIYIMEQPSPIFGFNYDYFVYGTLSPPHVLDPVNSWDQASNDVIDQVCETLFTYDWSDHNLPRIPLLTESYWWESDTILHIKVREGIVFHDLTPFNANATKWNFDRLLYLTNCTGILPDTMVPGDPSPLFFFPDGVTPIINNVVSDGFYNVTITLNAPFAPFLDLLCYTAGAMISPASSPDDDFISLTYGRLIGTGPFVYEYYVPNVEVRLGGFKYYWQGAPFFDEIIMAFISDATTRNNAMLSHEIDWLSGVIPSLIPTFDADPTIHIEHFTDNYHLPGLVYQYLGMNNKLIPTYWRKAISYAINYSYIINELMQGRAVRANSPISPGYGAPYNASNSAPDYDLLTARQIIIDNVPAASEFPLNDNPFDFMWLNATLFTVNYTYNIGNFMREVMYVALSTWLPAIGITVVDDGITWSRFLQKLFSTPNDLDLFFIGWGPDYKEPFNILDPLFNPTSYANCAQVNDTKLNTLMALALTTTNDVARDNIYKNIQWYLSNRLYPHCFGYHSKIIYVHSANIGGVSYNALNKFYAYPIYRT